MPCLVWIPDLGQQEKTTNNKRSSLAVGGAHTNPSTWEVETREKFLNVHANEGMNRQSHQKGRGGDLLPGQAACEPSSATGSFLVPAQPR